MYLGACKLAWIALRTMAQSAYIYIVSTDAPLRISSHSLYLCHRHAQLKHKMQVSIQEEITITQTPDLDYRHLALPSSDNATTVLQTKKPVVWITKWLFTEYTVHKFPWRRRICFQAWQDGLKSRHRCVERILLDGSGMPGSDENNIGSRLQKSHVCTPENEKKYKHVIRTRPHALKETLYYVSIPFQIFVFCNWAFIFINKQIFFFITVWFN